MSKKIIAGAGVLAGLAVALAPVATFAEATISDATWNSDEHTDTLNVTVLPTCAFGSASASPAITGVAHNATSDTPDGTTNSTNAAAWTTNDTANQGMTPDLASQTENKATDVATYRIFAGTTDENFATTTFKVVCNQTKGYKVYAEMANLAGTGTMGNIAPSTTWSASSTGYSITSSATDSDITAAGKIGTSTKTAIATKSKKAAADGDEIVVTYGIGIAPAQESGTYTGNVVYTLVQQIESEVTEP